MTLPSRRPLPDTHPDDVPDLSVRTPVHVMLAEAGLTALGFIVVGLLAVTVSASRALLIVTAAGLCGVGAVALASRWWRGCSLLPDDAQQPGLRVRGLVRSHDVPWDKAVAVSWTPYVPGGFFTSRYLVGRYFTWAKTWVTFVDESDAYQALPVLVTRSDEVAGDTAKEIREAAPASLRERIGLHSGPPVIPIPVVVVPGKPLTIAGWLLDSRLDRLDCTIVARPGSVEFVSSPPSSSRRWDDVVAVDADLGTSKSSPPEIVVTVTTASGDAPVFLVEREDSEAALAWAAGAL